MPPSEKTKLVVVLNGVYLQFNRPSRHGLFCVYFREPNAELILSSNEEYSLRLSVDYIAVFFTLGDNLSDAAGSAFTMEALSVRSLTKCLVQ